MDYYRRRYAARLLRLAAQERQRAQGTAPEHVPAPQRSLLDAVAALNRERRHEDAIAACNAALRESPSPELYFQLIWALVETNQTESARRVAASAAQSTGEPMLLASARHLSLPVIYEDALSVMDWRSRFITGLHQLVDETILDTASAVTLARRDIQPNFYLGYQNFNDMPLLRLHGRLIDRIMRASLPPRRISTPRPKAGERIRIGYVSEGHDGIDPLFFAWMTELDPAAFEIISYQIGGIVDPERPHPQRFHHLPESVDRVSERILGDRVHVLVYFYVGTGSLLTKLAALRLAPVQCAAWGHPMTTGLANIDYFLSNDSMEPEAAELHYSETLVRLPGLGTAIPPLFLPPRPRPRSAFGLADDEVIFLAAQAPAKYLPCHDRLFSAIARRVPSARFVFIQRRGEEITRILMTRIAAALDAAGLNSQKLLRLMPSQPYDAYLDLLRCADVFLDTIGWSGGLTTLDAVQCGLPVVTLPGEFLRGRQSLGILKQIGVESTIAADTDDYVEIAVRLGLDADARRAVSERLRQGADRLTSDRGWVPALESFFKTAVTRYSPA